MKTNRGEKKEGTGEETYGVVVVVGGASSIQISAAPQWGEGGWGEKERRKERMKVGLGGEGENENEELPFASLTSLHRNKA